MAESIRSMAGKAAGLAFVAATMVDETSVPTTRTSNKSANAAVSGGRYRHSCGHIDICCCNKECAARTVRKLAHEQNLVGGLNSAEFNKKALGLVNGMRL